MDSLFALGFGDDWVVGSSQSDDTVYFFVEWGGGFVANAIISRHKEVVVVIIHLALPIKDFKSQNRSVLQLYLIKIVGFRPLMAARLYSYINR